jgi:hypothetical protein
MTSMQLFRVTVTQEWSAEAEALVWAPDDVSAKRLAQKRVEVDIEDAYSDSCWSVAKPEPLDEAVMDRMDDDLWLILPDGEVCDNDRAGLAKFQALLDPERLEALRLARIEAGNGQLALLEVAA